MVSSFPEEYPYEQPSPNRDYYRHDAEKDRLILRGFGEPAFQTYLLDFNNILAIAYQFPLLKTEGFHLITAFGGRGWKPEIVLEKLTFGDLQARRVFHDVIEGGPLLDLEQPLPNDGLVFGGGFAPDEVHLHLAPHRGIAQFQLLGGFLRDNLVQRFAGMDFIDERGVGNLVLLHSHPERTELAFDGELNGFFFFGGEFDDQIGPRHRIDPEEEDFIPGVGQADFHDVFRGRGDHLWLRLRGDGQGRRPPEADQTAGQGKDCEPFHLSALLPWPAPGSPDHWG